MTRWLMLALFAASNLARQQPSDRLQIVLGIPEGATTDHVVAPLDAESLIA